MNKLKKMKLEKNLASAFALGLVAAVCASFLAACGGGELKQIDFPRSPPGQGFVGVGPNDPAPPAQEPDPELPTGVIDFDCVPSAPINGQNITIKSVTDDGQADGAGLYPVGAANATYSFAANDFTVVSDNEGAYVPSPNAGTYSVNGNVIAERFPIFTPDAVDPFANSLSIIRYSPSDWMQRATRQPELAVEGGEYVTRVVLRANGKLPYILAALYGVNETDAENNAIEATFTATIKRLPNGPVALAVGAVSDACNYSVELTRPKIAESEDNALESFALYGGGLEPLYANLDDRLFLEPYMPMLAGEFSTSSTVPFVPVRSRLEHTYGVSSLAQSIDVLTNKGSTAPAKALEPAAPAAMQTIEFVSATTP